MAIIIFPLLAVSVFYTNEIHAVIKVDDAAKTYKTKCLMCHGPTAAKFYDPEAPEEEQVHAILKGKKGEKPPFMPEYESKGIDEEQAKALVEYMKNLRNPDGGGN